MSVKAPEYKLYIDWFGHGALNAGIADWYYPESDPVTPDEVVLVTTPAYQGGEAIKVTGGNLLHNFRVVAGPPITYTVWVYLPTVGDPGTLSISSLDPDGNLYGSVSTTVNDTWVPLELTYDSSIPGDWTANIFGASGPTEVFYVGWMEARSEYDDVSCDIAATRTVPEVVYGRDHARDLDTIRPGEIDLELKNPEGKFTPGNVLSPIVDGLVPNRQVLLTAEFESTVYVMYSGYTQNFIVNARLNEQSVSVPCQDILGRLATVNVATPLFDSTRTGEAFSAVVRESGVYPTINPSIAFTPPFIQFNPWVDSGASTLRGWSHTGSAISGIKDIITAEGPPAIYSVGISNQIVYRDRVHRQRASYPTTPTMVLAGCETPGAFKIHDTSSVDYGWTDIANQVDYSYEVKTVSGDYSTVWSQPGDVALGTDAVNDVYTFSGIVPGGFFDAQTLIEGKLQKIETVGPDETDIVSGVFPEDYDYILVRGEVTSAEPVNINGTRVLIEMTADSATTTVRDVSLRARAIESDSVDITIQDEDSIAAYGTTKSLALDFGPVTRPDAEAVAALVLLKRSTIRPTVTAVIKNLSPLYTAALLAVDLSAPVRVTVAQWAIDNDFTIESISHEPAELGEEHVVTLQMEQVRTGLTNEDNAFTFNDAALGFDNGQFGSTELNPSTVFLLGASQLNSQDMLTY